jgi:hypothetical protein
MDSTTLFIEETTPQGYAIRWQGGTPLEAVSALQSLQTPNRLELWSKAHAATDMGYAPMAFRDAGETIPKIGLVFKMLSGI